MIVRGDADKILNCINSQEGLMDCAVIALDSGVASNDTYALLIQKDSPTFYVYRQVFTNFADARNEALEVLLQRHPDLDYVYWVDSDDHVEGDISSFRKKLEEVKPKIVVLDYDYHGKYGLKRNRFWRAKKGKSICKWEGVAHEVDVQVIEDEGELVFWDDLKIVHNQEAGFSPVKRSRNIDLLKKYVEENPDNARSKFYLGREYLDSGQFDEALDTFLAYLKIANFTEEIYQAMIDMMRIYIYKKKEYELAIKIGFEAITLCPNIAYAATLLGEAYRFQSKWALASVWYEYAALSPHGPVLFELNELRNIIPLRWLSLMCYKLGRKEEAIAWHEEAGNCDIQDELQEYVTTLLREGEDENNKN